MSFGSEISYFLREHGQERSLGRKSATFFIWTWSGTGCGEWGFNNFFLRGVQELLFTGTLSLAGCGVRWEGTINFF